MKHLLSFFLFLCSTMHAMEKNELELGTDIKEYDILTIDVKAYYYRTSPEWKPTSFSDQIKRFYTPGGTRLHHPYPHQDTIAIYDDNRGSEHRDEYCIKATLVNYSRDNGVVVKYDIERKKLFYAEWGSSVGKFTSTIKSEKDIKVIVNNECKQHMEFKTHNDEKYPIRLILTLKAIMERHSINQ